jgi:hypothetical protein
MARTSQHPSEVGAEAAALQHLPFFSYLYFAVLSVNCFVSVKFHGILWTIFVVWYLIFMLYAFVLCIVDNQFTTFNQQYGQGSPLYIYLLTPRSRVILEKQTASQLVKKFPTFYET